MPPGNNIIRHTLVSLVRQESDPPSYWRVRGGGGGLAAAVSGRAVRGGGGKMYCIVSFRVMNSNQFSQRRIIHTL